MIQVTSYNDNNETYNDNSTATPVGLLGSAPSKSKQHGICTNPSSIGLVPAAHIQGQDPALVLGPGLTSCSLTTCPQSHPLFCPPLPLMPFAPWSLHWPTLASTTRLSFCMGRLAQFLVSSYTPLRHFCDTPVLVQGTDAGPRVFVAIFCCLQIVLLFFRMGKSFAVKFRPTIYTWITLWWKQHPVLCVYL